MFEVRVQRGDDVIEVLTAETYEEAEALLDRWAELEGCTCAIHDLEPAEDEVLEPDDDYYLPTG